MKTLLIPLVILSICCISCTEVVDADRLLDTEEQFRIVGFISPSDTLLSISVTKALPAIGTELSVNDIEANRELFLVEDAFVTLSDSNGNSADLTYNDQLDTYTAPATILPILAGESYFLEVVAEERTFSASCEIPMGAIEITEEIRFDQNAFGERIGTVTFGFEDLVGQRNFYAVGARVRTIVEGTNGEEPMISDFSLFVEDNLLTDNLGDGISLASSASLFIPEDVNTQETTLILQVANMEEVLFQSLRASTLNTDAIDNPFLELVIAPNTILEGGAIGVFAGYDLQEKLISVEQEIQQ